MKAELIIIGDEILSGRRVDTNSAYISTVLSELGIHVIRKTVVSDAIDDIVTAFKESLKRVDIVISSGGLGPTPDDTTRFALSKVVERPLEENIEAKCMLMDYLAKATSPSANLQVMMPAGSVALKNPVGVAPGILFRTNSNKIIIALPGVPQEMKAIMDKEVRRYLVEIFGFQPIKVRLIRTTGIFEIRILERLEQALGERTKLIAFYPSYEGVDLRIVGNSYEADETFEECKRILDGFIYAYEEKDLSEIVGERLRESGKTLSVAESCTGGMLASRIVDISGSSDYFLGGVVGYANDVKMRVLGVSEEKLKKFGAVSYEVASDMAVGIKGITGSDYALSTTGVAGPTGGTRTKPVGLVYIGLASPDGVFVREYRFKGTREAIRRRTTQSALFLLFLSLTNRLDNFPFEDMSKEVGL